jgi:hypothetical protein
MLSDHERYVLNAIEHDLYDDDPDFASAFRAGRHRRLRRIRHWPSLLLTAAGLAMIVIGLLGRVTPLLIEGGVVALSGYGYGRWHAGYAADRPARPSRRPRRPRPPRRG